MKNNRLNIQINKPVSEVFQFTLNPKNTPRWIDFVASETTSDWPVRVGTVYENQSKTGHKSLFILTSLKENVSFELKSPKEDYFVRYTFTPMPDGSTAFEYYEWVPVGELEVPFTQEILEKLKLVLENYA